MEDKKMTVSLFEIFYKYIVKVADDRGDKNSHFVVWMDNDTVEILGDVLKLLKEQETDWISVKDRLPEAGQKVLTYSKFGHVSDRTLERHAGMNGYDVLLFSPDGMKPGTDITHWMPLPEPPKAGDP